MEDFKVQNFYHLLDYDFHIPSFQRGYRWEAKQVVDLLEDLKEFQISLEEETASASFYCLQPVVVYKRNNNSFDLLDGQQRLTTAYLILSYLEGKVADEIGEPKLYGLHFDSRVEDDDYVMQRQFKNDSMTHESNVDFFYMRQAYTVIEDWFSKNRLFKTPIAKLFAAPPKNKKDETNKDIRVIWYEVENKLENAKKSAIQVFSRLNYGKIELSKIELIKALILQCDIYGSNKDKMRQWVLKVSTDWDYIEKELQKPNFWSMLSGEDYESTAHIGLVFEFVAKQYLCDYDEEHKCFKRRFNVYGEDESTPMKEYFIKCDAGEKFIHEVISKYLSCDFENRVKTLWEHVLDTFAVFKEWYGSPENTRLYHLVSLLMMLDRTVKKEKGLLFTLFKNYNEDKEGFENELRYRIGRKVLITSYVWRNEEKVPNTLNTINYNENRKEIVNILELLNVNTIIEKGQDGMRFDFYKFKEQNVTSLEHIHPQHLDEENIGFEELKSWAKRKKEDFDVTSRKGDSFILQAFEKIGSCSSEEEFRENNNEYMECIHTIDKAFDELARMKDSVMHSIRNMALLDKDTNAALQRGLLDKKREKLKERRDEGFYIPVATWNVFNKFYTPGNVEDLKFWTESDRDAYYNEIERVYNLYTNKQ